MIFKKHSSIEDNYCQLAYLFKIFNKLAPFLDDEYNVILTSHFDLELKDYDVDKRNIVFFIGDEIGITPVWKDKVDFIFRQYNKNSLCDYKSIFPIPCGFNGPIIVNGIVNNYQSEIPKLPLLERQFDLFYSGQFSWHRKRMIWRLQRVKGQYNSMIKETKGFRQGFTINEYYDFLNNSKIAFVPNGVSVPESFRYVEAFESFCIAITTYPIHKKEYSLWYYENSPAVFLDSWSSLNKGLLDRLLDKDALQEYYEKNRIYYNSYLSTDAVVSYILDKILG